MTASAEAAESFWLRGIADGAGSCCGLGSGAGQTLEAFWRDVFSTVRPGSRVLEIGCGAGQVSNWAADAGRQLEVIASDIHDRPEAVKLRPGVAFLGRARAEALPLPPESIDIVVSNFAFEYTPSTQQAAGELVRVLRPGGAGALVIHSKDSTVTASGHSHLGAFRKLVEADVPGRIRRAAALRIDHLSRRKLLKDVLKMGGQLAGAEPYLKIADRLLQGDQKARQDYETLEKNVETATEVSQRQIQAALDESGLAELKQQFARLGVEVFTSEITGTYGSVRQKFGWLMFLDKPVRPSANAAAS